MISEDRVLTTITNWQRFPPYRSLLGYNRVQIAIRQQGFAYNLGED